MIQKIEQKLVEDYLVNELQKRGWNFVSIENIERESLSEPVLTENFSNALQRLNSDIGISEEEINKVIQELKLLPSSPQGLKKFLYYFKYGIDIKFEKERIIKNIKLVDFEQIERNEFLILRQLSFKGAELIRPDILLFINGLPLVNIECKSPIKEKISWEEALGQIKEYSEVAPELYKYVQLAIAVGDYVRYFPIIPWQKIDNIKVYQWKEEDKDELGSILEFLTPQKLLDILRNYLFIREERGELTKVIGRYMQYRAGTKIYERVINNLEGKDTKNKGLIWHWQGSGKTLTMIFSAHKLYFDKRLERPTIFFIVDRQDLEEQLNDELNSLDLNFTAERIESINHLKEIISHNNFQGKRGVFVTLIHKFSPGEFKEFEQFISETEKNSKKITPITERKNIICFLDEVHRSQYGLLAAQMKQILKNAFFFGFTGTPIAEDEKNTYLAFGYPLKEENYLDKYFIDDSIKDGFTVPIVFQSRRDDVHLKKEELTLFLSKEIEGEDLDEALKTEIKNNVSKALNHIKVFLEDEKRIQQIVNDIAIHFKENVDGRFKAMIVAGSRKACVLYKKYLDQVLPREYSEIVMTFNLDDTGEIKEYYQKWKKEYSNYKDDEKIREAIRDSFKNKELPKILIVTDMLLTGFDAPILQTMYLDKVLKKHRLLQAIARVNRPFFNLKYSGVIIDYVGILKELKEAFQYYYQEPGIKGVVGDVNVLSDRFKQLIRDLIGIFSGLPIKIERDILLKAVEVLKDETKEQFFIERYKELRKLFELLTSFSVKLEYLNEYKWLSAIYVYYLKLLNQPERQELVEQYCHKTLDAIHQSIEIKKIEKLPTFSLNLKYFEELKKSGLGKEEVATVGLFALEKFVLVEQKKNPVYKSILEKVEELVDKWRSKNIDYDLLLKSEESLINSIKHYKQEQESLNLKDLEYTIYLILGKELKLSQKELLELTRNLYDGLNKLLLDNWIENPVLRKNISRTIREFLLGIKSRYGIPLEKVEEMYNELNKVIENYG